MSSGRPIPFGPEYQRREERQGGLSDDACCVCGKPVKSDPVPFATVLDGGSRFAGADETIDTADPGYMGGYPVGPSCAKRLRKANLKLD